MHMYIVGILSYQYACNHVVTLNMNNTYMRAQEAPLVTNETMEAIDATQGAVN